jgi:hypothetical protein
VAKTKPDSRNRFMQLVVKPIGPGEVAAIVLFC